ncbi:MAG: extracellular solute-binding protein [Aphanothece sp. CMT-3BRIN-NPC111]|jgi:putative spermidine/putrescine transport system substrate-binding protein|nr:extracellular solute-binding protein [Aphanothece sp. CMT-3BRIN-NPC111]
MINRRSFLLGAGTLAMSQLATGCGGSQSETLRVKLLKNSIPVQVLNEFRQSLKQPAALDLAPEAQLKELFARLVSWQRPTETGNDKRLNLPFFQPKAPVIADLVTLGDYWLTQAIEQKLIQPLAPNKLKSWQQLPPRWQELVRRNDKGQLDSSGQVWGAPYRWGTTVIVYRRDKFKSLGWIPTDWSDLWREELRDRISVVDQWREVIGLTLKYLGHSYNTQQLDKISDLKETLLKLHRQVKFYSSDAYLQPLILGDTWLAVGWSTDVLQIMKSDRQIAAVVPQSGTALWADLWVQPASADAQPNSQLRENWIDFCWQPKPASTISLWSSAASPVLTSMNSADIPKDVRENPLLLPDAQILQKSEFLHPLPEASEKQYLSLWQEIRQS